MAYAAVQDVATTLGRPITDPDEQNQVIAWISGCELKIRTRLGDIDGLDQDILRYVISEAVARRVRNPEGKQNERIDDYSYGLSSEAARAEIYLTEDEWAMLAPSGSASPSWVPTAVPEVWYGGTATRSPDAIGGIFA